MLLHGKVYHIGRGTTAMPVFFPRRDPHGIAGANLANGIAPKLDAPDAGDDVQRLTERMRVPGGARARLESYPGAADARRRRCLDDRILPYRSGE